MNRFRNVFRWPPRPCALRVIVLTARTAVVYPPPGALSVSHATRAQTPSPCRPRALSSLLFPLRALPLSGRVTVGKVRQTR